LSRGPALPSFVLTGVPGTSSELISFYRGLLYAVPFRLSWKWRKRSVVKITERTREEDTETLHRRRESGDPEAAFAGLGADLETVR
jgi:hypothetical protein